MTGTTIESAPPDLLPVPLPAPEAARARPALVPAALLALLLAVIYAPLLAEAARVWVSDGASQHGALILPIALGLVWMLRHKIRACRPAPISAGAWLLGAGLLLETASFLLRVRWFPLLSLVPVLAGAVLALHGRALWRVLRFPILFLVFLAPVPAAVTGPAAAAIQRLSTTGTAQALTLLGVPTVQDGFEIVTPSLSVEVAQECSGFKKLTTLLAFAVFYGYVYALPWPRRLLLVLAVPPVALAVNVLRILGLVLIGSAGGPRALHAAHDGAEVAVVVASFALLTWAGKGLGCRSLQFYR